jgi:uncharacterized protein YjbI with pentapeptide repeats
VLGSGTAADSVRKVSSHEKKALAAGIPILTEADFLVAAAPDADEVRSWTASELNNWRKARPKAGMHTPIEVPALFRIDWPGADLTNADLQYADLSGANLEGADLTGANAHGLSLRGANLVGAKLADVWSLSEHATYGAER